MKTVFISKEIWPQLTKAVRDSRQPCDVAVAYFGAGASRMLPLPENSCLVVDASDGAVASGQTCPFDLIKLSHRGVRIYSIPNLHAKVFVVGRAAYVGSANVSSRSASQLIEAIVHTNDVVAVRAARAFVRGYCLHELTPTILVRLSKLYRPPRVFGGRKQARQSRPTNRQPTLPALRLAQLTRQDWSESESAIYQAGLPAASKRTRHSGNYEIQSFKWTGKCPFQRGDVVCQVTRELDGSYLVSAPGNVLHLRSKTTGKRIVSFVYVECPRRRRRRIEQLATALGDGAMKRLRQNGLVRHVAFAQSLLNAWND